MYRQKLRLHYKRPWKYLQDEFLLFQPDLKRVKYLKIWSVTIGWICLKEMASLN